MELFYIFRWNEIPLVSNIIFSYDLEGFKNELVLDARKSLNHLKCSIHILQTKYGAPD